MSLLRQFIAGAVFAVLMFSIIACDPDDSNETPVAGDDDNNDDDDNDDNNNDNDDSSPLPPPTVKTLSWLHVEDGALVDEYGRQWLMRGINARVEGLFDGSGEWAIAPAKYEAWDAWAMANCGFNLFRLPINWSGLEPVEGDFNEDYLALLDQVVQWAAAAGLYVLIDFHQDKYSKFVGDDGAPRWAVHPPPPDDPRHDDKSVTWRQLAAMAAYLNNFERLQDRFLPAWQLVITRYADEPGVAGFEVINEPYADHIPRGWHKLYLYYEKCAAALRDLDERHTLWLEPDVFRNKFLWAPIRREPFPDGNVVYAPHLYPNFNGMSYPTADEWVAALTWTFDHLLAEADSWGGAAPVIGEWGTHPYDSFAPALFEAIQDLADVRRIGLAFWVWKEKSSGHWGLFDYEEATDSWTPRTGPGVDALRRPGAMAVPGHLIAQSFDAEVAELTVEFEAAGDEGPPLLYLPEGYYPEGVTVLLDGAPLAVDIDPDTQRALLPWDGAAGVYQLVARPADRN